ncbi:uncharacterized protein F5147DRAFT_744679 [Suillus discolor]|uniref:Uncharacterized protein n=1 Tax=Suillus discolor TaxID=1912936 RepID=A0A9P7FBW0_9AGAM|nr:uncharacterized protein F5147DRAFT_744679 [Suillus discolor]KAG2112041.1 hypothetical protein F5147DRAFT_744679 [Suillus discolor]
MYIEGTGYTEGEGCEHHQTIEQHFAFWDNDKYTVLKALTASQTLTVELSSLEGVLNLIHTDFIHFHKEERSYLDILKEPPIKDHVNTTNCALVDIYIGSFQEMHIAINQAWIRVGGAYSKLQNTEAMTSHLKIQLGIDKQWEISSEPYSQFRQEASLLTYCTALNDLERLIIMHLFELLKLLLSGIDIVEYSFLGEFDLLCQSRSDIHTLDWTKPAHCEATKYLKLSTLSITRNNLS